MIKPKLPRERARKPRADSVLGQLPLERQEAVMDYADGHTLAETTRWLADSGVNTSTSALSNWLSSRRVEALMRRTETAVEKLISHLEAARPGWTPFEIQMAGQAMFTALAIEQQDIKVWRAAQAVALKREQLDLDHARFKEGLNTKFHRGLQALAKAFKRNPQALQLYNEARELIRNQTK